MTDYSAYTVGVLALQGAVSEHIAQLTALGAKSIAVKRIEQLAQIDALILPGGESTAIGKLMREYHFIEAIQQFGMSDKPIFGTCAGMIILAKHIEGGEPAHLGLMDISVQRNAFGRQVESFQTKLTVQGIASLVDAIFIRAPLITKIHSQDVEVLAKVDNQVVLAKQANYLACSFHPEISDDTQIIRYFLDMLK